MKVGVIRLVAAKNHDEIKIHNRKELGWFRSVFLWVLFYGLIAAIKYAHKIVPTKNPIGLFMSSITAIKLLQLSKT